MLLPPTHTVQDTLGLARTHYFFLRMMELIRLEDASLR